MCEIAQLPKTYVLRLHIDLIPPSRHDVPVSGHHTVDLITTHHWSSSSLSLTLPVLRLLSSKAQERKDFYKLPKPCHVGTHWKALAECSQMSTNLSGFRSFFRIFASFCIGQSSHQQHKS